MRFAMLALLVAPIAFSATVAHAEDTGVETVVVTGIRGSEVKKTAGKTSKAKPAKTYIRGIGQYDGKAKKNTTASPQTGNGRGVLRGPQGVLGGKND